MTDVCILVKSGKPETYKAIVAQLRLKIPSINKIIWCFYQIPKNVDLVKNTSADLSIEYKEAKNPKDISLIAKYVSIFDVSGLPKQDFTEILSVVIGKKNFCLYILNGSYDNPQYIDVMTGPAISSFSKWYATSLIINKLIFSIISIFIFSFALLKITELIPNSGNVTTWLGITIGLISLFLSIPNSLKN